jgi:NADH-quinone oxidoreductase subunit L
MHALAALPHLLVALSTTPSASTLADWLWLLPALPLAGSFVCALLHFATLAQRSSTRPHRAHDMHGDHGDHAAAHASHSPNLHSSAHHGATSDSAHDPARGPGSPHGEEPAHVAGHAPVPAGASALAPIVASLAMAIAFALAVYGFTHVRGAAEHAIASSAWSWIDTGTFPIDVAIVLDPLSSVMVLVITGVGLLIHIYAAGYMKGDAGYAKFFAFLNLFVFAMLMLVCSSSLLGLFIGWEGVGLCSYLLIGFWYEKGWPAEAGQKAFVMNRIGDACFLVGSFLLARVFHTLDMSTIANGVGAALAAHRNEIVLAGFLLFGGACGKSAQLPLFTWLPDAMAGPTPVSALIHAATMVTAGVYLVVRLNPLFAASPELLFFVALVGAITGFIAGSTALVQRDIKKVLAYSTVSQLGYMFLALGSGAFASGIFHLVTHAFFKALLFLGAGSVIHGMHEEQDMHKMGGLRKYMPQTFVTFLCGAAALSGLPLMSGFFSKDEILAHAFEHGGAYYVLWFIGLVTAAMTAFYTWRMVALTFFGPERFHRDVSVAGRFRENGVHPHESPSVMTVPLMVLAVLSVLGGVLGLPAVFGAPNAIGEWLAPVLEPGRAILESHGAESVLSHAQEWMLLGVGAVVALYFAHRGFHTYERGIEPDVEMARVQPAAVGFLEDAWGIDRAYTHWIVQPVKLAAFVIAVLIDQFAIDGLVNGAAALARGVATRSRRMASGHIATYGLWMGGVTALIAFYFLVRS